MGAMTAKALPRFHVGPMSFHTVNAAIAVAYRHRAPLCLIGSRRQIECTAQGGGYVNNWTTESFADYVRTRDPDGLITLARDHGGPYQRGQEQSAPLDQAMALAQNSFSVDILSGLKVLHLDPEKAVERTSADAAEQFTQLTIQMLLASDRFAKQNNMGDVTFEIGTDENIGEDFSPEQWDRFLDQVMSAAASANANLPISFAAPMGTKVKEMRNVGGMALRTSDMAKWEERIAALKDIAARYNLILKLHNSDYISREVIDHYLRLGVTCMNVAPEFGVVESRALTQLLQQHDLMDMLQVFEAISLASRRWQRWLLPDSQADDMEKSLMAGHYVFSEPAVEMMRGNASQQLAQRGVNLQTELQAAVEQAIEHYLLPLTAAGETDVRNQRTA